MSGELLGTLCVVKAGTYALPTAIVGQGTLAIATSGDLIPIDNKSTGQFMQYLPGASTTQGQIATVEFDYNDDAGFLAMLAAASTKSEGAYVLDMIGYYYEGTYIPQVTAETGNKNEIVKVSVTFTANGAFTRTVV